MHWYNRYSIVLGNLTLSLAILSEIKGFRNKIGVIIPRNLLFTKTKKFNAIVINGSVVGSIGLVEGCLPEKHIVTVLSIFKLV